MQEDRAWQVRLREWQGLTFSFARQQVPAVYSWLGSQVDMFVQKQNLTEVRSPWVSHFASILCFEEESTAQDCTYYGLMHSMQHKC